MFTPLCNCFKISEFLVEFQVNNGFVWEYNASEVIQLISDQPSYYEEVYNFVYCRPQVRQSSYDILQVINSDGVLYDLGPR